MGILNITPDSFSDSGKFFSPESAIKQAVQLEEEGADILDIGGESSRPGSASISVQEEMSRVIPVIEKIKHAIEIPISIDTCKSEVAKAAIEAGASIINDISGLRFDKNMVEVAKKHDTPVIIMHMKGEPKTMQINIHYDCVIKEIYDFFQKRIEFATNHGIAREQIILDPGIGFGKHLQHNLKILNNLHEFKSLGLPILVGTSRKAFIGQLLDRPVDDRMEGTLASIAAALYKGASIVRVHDVSAARSFLTITEAIQSA